MRLILVPNWVPSTAPNFACVEPQICNNPLMHVVMEALVQLQKLEFGPNPESPSAKAAAEKLRAQIPYQILGHYERLRAQGKKGLALVRNNRVCAECHMSIPIGMVVSVMKGDDVQLCGNCGRYLFVEPQAAPAEPPPAAAPKPKRARKPKQAADLKK